MILALHLHKRLLIFLLIFLKSVYTDDANIDWKKFDEAYFPNFDIKSFIISENDMLDALIHINHNTAAGPDRLPAIFLKNCSKSLALPLARLFNWSLDSGTFPTSWKSSFVKPIFKSGKRNDICNYRGIAKLSAIPKLFEKMVCDQIYGQCNNFILENQHGFIKGKSTSTNLLEFTSHVISQMELGYQIDSVYTDFSKAFDKVSHQIMTYKLHRYGFEPNLVKWINSYLSDRFQIIKMDSYLSKRFPVLSGVPQGSHLGPLLFAVLINDIVNVIKSNVLLYADDMKIYRDISSTSDCLVLQSDMDRISEWCVLNKISLNIAKCKVISFCRKKTTLNHHYVIDGSILERVEKMLDLGVLLDCKLNFKLHINSVISRSNRMLGFIKRSAREFDDPFAIASLYFSLVRSILEYANVVWCPYYAIDLNRIERVQRNFSRFALRRLRWIDNVLPSYDARLKLLGLSTLEERRNMSCAVFVFDVLQGKISSPYLLSRLNFKVPRLLRQYQLLYTSNHRTNYGQHEPVNNMCSVFNKYDFLFDFNITRTVFKNRIRNLMNLS